MGTIFNQQPRNSHSFFNNDILIEIEMLQDIAFKAGLTFDQVLETKKVLEMERRNNLYHANGDIFDEQMSGIHELMESLIIAFKESFGVDQTDNAPKFLEAIAIQLGFDTKYGNNTIPDAIRDINNKKK